MDRRSRLRAFTVVILLATALFGLQALAADASPALSGVDDRSADADRPPENATLIGIQSYGGFGGNNGKALVVDRGDVVWEYDPANSRVFDVEYLGDGRIMASVATKHGEDDCPEEFLDSRYNGAACVENRVVEIDYGTKEVVWEYSWYDHYISHHEVHDADRLENGETAIIDMGNDRAFTVDRAGDITWNWSATEHLAEGTEFYEEHGGPERGGPESDWTHMNDIDRLENGNYQLSIRNYDVLIEVDPETGEVVDTIGEPRERVGSDALLYEQHNPHRLESQGTVLVANSEANEIIEVDVESEEVVWRFTGDDQSIVWPRDADRMPNGHTLVTDSLGFRVVEVNRQGEVVWEYRVENSAGRGIPYEADRIGVSEEAASNVSGRQLESNAGRSASQVDKFGRYVDLYLPVWAGLPARLTLLVGMLASLGASLDLLVALVGRGVAAVRGR
jgi:outer membrane protein assembly factor BamB